MTVVEKVGFPEVSWWGNFYDFVTQCGLTMVPEILPEQRLRAEVGLTCGWAS